MAHGLTCWKCGASLEALTLPLRRLEECKACHCELHVCRLCVEYDTRVAKHCREPTAEEVRDKTAANFCDHFKPKVGAYVAPTRRSRCGARGARRAVREEVKSFALRITLRSIALSRRSLAPVSMIVVRHRSSPRRRARLCPPPTRSRR